MSRFIVTPTPLSGLVRIARQRLGDPRGFLSRLYCEQELAEIGFTKPIAQINHTATQTQGTVRGMHYQRAPYSEDKYISCLKGEVFDVAVDLRPQSPTFLHWHGEILSADNMHSLFIPAGFAHGFQTLTDACELLYLHTVPYHPEAEAALHACDPRLRIAWPLPISIISDRDRAHPFINDRFLEISVMTGLSS